MVLIIDAKEAVVGRVAAYAAKQAMLGKEVKVINAEKAIMSGSKEWWRRPPTRLPSCTWVGWLSRGISAGC